MTIVPSSASALQVFKPSGVSGTLIATLSAIFLSTSASFIIVAWSSATTSAEIGPGQIRAISRTTSMKSRPDLWISEGLVVTPSSSPLSAKARMSAIGGVGEEFHGSCPYGLRRICPAIANAPMKVTRFEGETTMSEHILIDRRGALLSLTLARPERRNAITVAMYAALADAIEGAASDPAVRLITLEGQGEDFTGGNDLADFLKDMPAPGSDTDIPCGACSGRSPPMTCRWSPRCMATPSASARPCCSTATSCLPNRAAASSCRSSISGWCPKRRVR